MQIRLVLADDHLPLRTQVRVFLESDPKIRVVGEANTGQEAVDAVRQFQPDVAILDIAMPKLNGIEATRQICAEHWPTQVIIFSAYATRHHVQAALQAGARGYVCKGTDVIHLMQAVHTVVAGQRFLGPLVEIHPDFPSKGIKILP